MTYRLDEQQLLIFNGEQLTIKKTSMAKYKKEQNYQYKNKTHPNNLPLWQFYDKTSSHKSTQTLITELYNTQLKLN